MQVKYDPFPVRHEDIRRQCSYRTDEAIAHYYDMDVSEVQKIRASIPAQGPKRFLKDRQETGSASSGKQEEKDRLSDAVTGSAALFKALDAQFKKLARKRRYTKAEAQALLMNCRDTKPAGWRL